MVIAQAFDKPDLAVSLAVLFLASLVGCSLLAPFLELLYMNKEEQIGRKKFAARTLNRLAKLLGTNVILILVFAFVLDALDHGKGLEEKGPSLTAKIIHAWVIVSFLALLSVALIVADWLLDKFLPSFRRRGGTDE